MKKCVPSGKKRRLDQSQKTIPAMQKERKNKKHKNSPIRNIVQDMNFTDMRAGR